ncbi:hypothetical protein FO519_006675 [Halicephalobus sp. NKZ332]|nr:hypothetical protein FO519_006675 [Halicephalobus sp. NKZ332]
MTSQYSVTGQFHSRQQSVTSVAGGLLAMSSSTSVMNGLAGTASPLPSIAGSELNDTTINLQIFVPELQIQALPQSFNFGLFLPPCGSRAGKFLLEDRPIRDYPFHDCVPYLELKYKKRVYKMLKLDEKALKQMHSKSNLKKFMDYVQNRNSEKVEKWCTQGMDPNFHDPQGETPLTLASGIPNNRNVLIALVGGGAHLDFRNSEGQTGMHKAAFLSIAENVKTLLELGASPNYRDPIGLTPLYYSMLTTDSSDAVAEMLLSEAAEVGIVDMHGNHELHQACKNGLMKHVEHLLYYGADINAQNVNGNTPLHVCAVNNRPDCTRVLLFRGTDPLIQNKQGQTALHVAHIVAHLAVAEVIQSHNPAQAGKGPPIPVYGTLKGPPVPIYGTHRGPPIPVYGTHRGPPISGYCTQRGPPISGYCTQRGPPMTLPVLIYDTAPGHGPRELEPIPLFSVPYRGAPKYNTRRRLTNPILRRRSLSQSSICSAQSERYQTPQQVRNAMAGLPSPSPSCLTMMQENESQYSTLRRYPPNEVQSAPRAGFEPNTPRILVIPRGPKGFGFILRGAKHVDSEVEFEPTPLCPALQFFEGVDMSGMAMKAGLRPGDFLLEINGVDVRKASHEQVVHLIHQSDETITLKVITVDVPPGNGHYATGTGTMPSRRNHSVPRNILPPMPPQRHPSTSLSYARGGPMQHAMGFSMDDSSSNYNYLDSGTPQTSSKSMEALNYCNNSNNIRCASVKSRPSAARRISAAELEHLMVRQGTSSTSQFQPIPYEQDSPAGPKKYTSVAEMKRRKQRGMPSPSIHGLHRTAAETDPYYPPSPHLKSFNSSPDLQHQGGHHRKPSIDSMNADYSRPFRSAGNAPPPPPPPPPDFLKGGIKKAEKSEASLETKMSLETKKDADCRGISAEALTAVRLKPVDPNLNNNNVIKSSMAKPNPCGPKKSLDFDADLRNALAKRRSKVCIEEDDHGKSNSTEKIIKEEGTTVGRYGGLSLRESVRENVQPAAKVNGKIIQHSPPGGFANKKDSGYTSSRTSLEPSECGDEPSSNGGATPNGSNSSSTTIRIPDPPEGHRVTLISQQLEDSYGTVQQRKIALKPMTHDNVSISSTISTSSENIKNASGITNVTVPDIASGTLVYGRPLYLEPKMRTPPVDYEDPDSGTGDSDHDDRSAASGTSQLSGNSTTTGSSVQENFSSINSHGDFRIKDLISWTIHDVVAWLQYLDLDEYQHAFIQREISGADLLNFDRTKFTQLGVTRISHRQCMEQSLRSFSSG